MAALNSSVRAAIMVVVACVVAVVAGVALADPLESSGMITLAILIFVPMVPMLLRWYHPILLVAWNFELVLYFLRTEPKIRDVAIVWSAVVILLQSALDKRSRFQIHRPLLAPLLTIFAGVWVAILSNHSVGAIVGQGYFGGKRYLNVFLALVGCLVLGAVRIPKPWRTTAAAVFLLSTTSYAIGDFLYLLGTPGIVQGLFPSMIGYYEAVALGTLERLAGVGWAAMTVVLFLQMHYGVRGLLDMVRPWRGLLYLGFLGLSLVGGHRVALVLPLTVFMSQFLVERLYRTRYAAYLGVGVAMAGMFTIVFLDDLPIAVQRALSFLPGQKSLAAVEDADGTFEWRLEMWRVVFPQVPSVMWTGKGYLYSPSDQELAELGASRYLYSSFESSLVDGTYHQGFLTVIMPLGILTLAGFLWFLWVGVRLLRQNLKSGDPALRRINLFLYSAFVGRIAFYFLFYGQFDTDLEVFSGMIGLSMAVNGGVGGESFHRAGGDLSAAQPAPEIAALK